MVAFHRAPPTPRNIFVDSAHVSRQSAHAQTTIREGSVNSLPSKQRVAPVSRINASDMTIELRYGIVRDRPRRVIHVVLVDANLEFSKVDDIAGKMRAHVLAKSGEQDPNIVVVHGDSRETLRLVGDAQAVSRVRAALFNAAVTFSPLELDVQD